MISKFLEQIDRSDPTRSQYKIGLLDSSGKVLKAVDVSGVEAAYSIFDQVSKVVAGELDFEADDGVDYGGGSVEDQEAQTLDSDIVGNRAAEYDAKPMGKKALDMTGRKAKNVHTRYEKDVLNKAIGNLESEIQKYQNQSV